MQTQSPAEAQLSSAPPIHSVGAVEVVMLTHLNVCVNGHVMEYGLGEVLSLSQVEAADLCAQGLARRMA